MSPQVIGVAVEATATGFLAGILPIGTMQGEYMLTITISELSATGPAPPKARIVPEDTVNNFVAAAPVVVDNIQGPITPAAPVTHTWKVDHAPSLVIGVPDGAIRANIAKLEGQNAKLSFVATLSN